MTTLFEKAWAKLNLTLDVLGRREDGYHDLKSIMQTISLYDEVEMDVGTGMPWKLLCDREDIPCDERNLAWKAARLFCDTYDKDPGGITIRIRKNIPSGAGMGGGSADAAAVLRILNRYYGNLMSLDELAQLSASIGSDIPFCVIGGTVMCEGRGEVMRRLPACPACVIVGCKPAFSVSTPVLFKHIDSVEIMKHPDNDAMENAIEAGDLHVVAELIHNVFDPVVAQMHSDIGHIRAVFDDCGALASQMTGSGSVVFAIMPDMDSAQKACRELEKTYPQVFVAEPV